MALTRQLFAPAFRKNILSTSSIASRSISTNTLTHEQNLELLTKQRKLRPNSPHFTIYQPQLTWYSSIFNRITGNGLSVLFYAFGVSYLVAPTLGMPFDSASLVDTWASMPDWFKTSSKVIVGAPFWYHSFNGLRHLSWDMGAVLSLKSSYAAGYAVLGATAVATTVTAMI